MASISTDTVAVLPIQVNGPQVAEMLQFRPFPQFPKELRLQIIERLIEESAQRVFLVRQNGVFHVKHHKNGPEGIKGVVTVTKFPVPAFLHVNSEFRVAALKAYDLVFSGPLNNKPIYFNFTKDTLFFCSLSDLELMYNASSMSAWIKIEEKLRYMIINDEFHGSLSALENIAFFHNLKVFGHRTHEESVRAWRNAGNNARLKSVLEDNWSKGRGYEESLAAQFQSMALIAEPAVKDDYKLPRVDALSYQRLEEMVREG